MHQKIHSDHNTYLATGSSVEAIRAIYEAVESVLAVPVRGNPDFWHGSFSQFGIDESRDLKAMSAMRAFGERRVMIVETLLMSLEAQQAILKLTEEMSPGSYFFLIVPTHEHILPTLRSRLVHLKHGVEKVVVSEEARAFLAGDWSTREELLSEMHKAKDQRRAYLLLDHVEHLLLEKGDRAPLSAIIDAKKRLLEGIVPMKTTMETIGLLLPRAAM
jgi:DNA polymerase III delta prime subunit